MLLVVHAIHVLQKIEDFNRLVSEVMFADDPVVDDEWFLLGGFFLFLLFLLLFWLSNSWCEIQIIVKVYHFRDVMHLVHLGLSDGELELLFLDC